MPVSIKDYPSNSDKSKEERQKVSYNKPVVSGKVSVKRKNNIDEKIKQQTEELKRYTIQEVIMPSLKDGIWNIFTTALSTFLYNDTSSSVVRNGNQPTPYTSYSSVNSYNRMGRPRVSQNAVKTVKPRPEEEFVFATQQDANTVLDQLREAVANFGVVSVQTLFELCDKTAPFTANKYGWMDLEDAYVQHNREGYVLKLPRSLPLE